VNQKRNRKTINQNVAGGSKVGGSLPPRSSTVSSQRPPQTTYRIDVEDDGQERYDYDCSPLEYRGDHLFDGADKSHEAILAPTDTTSESALKSVRLIGQLLA
jgi:hypothetical protein